VQLRQLPNCISNTDYDQHLHLLNDTIQSLILPFIARKNELSFEFARSIDYTYFPIGASYFTISGCIRSQPKPFSLVTAMESADRLIAMSQAEISIFYFFSCTYRYGSSVFIRALRLLYGFRGKRGLPVHFSGRRMRALTRLFLRPRLCSLGRAVSPVCRIT